MNYQRLYTYRFEQVPQVRRDHVWAEVTSQLYEFLGRPERVLDPAAGRGEFINCVAASDRWAVDPVDYAERAIAPTVQLVVSPIMDAELPSGYFDGVFVSNFLEHLDSQESVSEFLEKMYSCMAPGGRIAIMGPNFRYCAREYFDFADHKVILTERSVAEHLYAAGFQPSMVRSRYLPYSFTGRLPSHPSLVRTYLKFPQLWKLFGKQFLVVAEKPSTGTVTVTSDESTQLKERDRALSLA